MTLIPARPSIADIEATAATLGIIKAWKKPFAYILNQTPLRGQRIDAAATTLSGRLLSRRRPLRRRSASRATATS